MTKGEQARMFNDMLEKQCQMRMKEADENSTDYPRTGTVIVELEASCSSPILARLDCDNMTVMNIWPMW